MSEKQIIVAILLITAGMAGIGFLFEESIAETSPSILDVGSGKTYSTIQSAINAASNGDIIRIFNGTYYENVIVDKTLTIVGEGPSTTIIDAGGSDSAMIVEADNCKIGGLAFTNSGGEAMEGFNTGLRLDSDYNIAQNCTAYDNYMGILSYWGENNKIIYCEAYENEIHGIGLGRYSTIQGSYSHDNDGDGFWAFVNPYSLLERCRAEDNGADGFSLDHTEDVTVKDFIARQNGLFGISVGGGSVGYNNVIEKSLIEKNGKGGMEIYNLEGPMTIWNNTIKENNGPGINFSRNVGGQYISIYENRIKDNDWYGVRIGSDQDCRDIRVYRNDFIDNGGTSKQGSDDNSGNLWDIQNRGNHWNEWTSPDANSDGIVDDPYLLDGTTSQKDNLPLTTAIFQTDPLQLSNDLWENGKFYVDFGITFPEPSVDDDDEPDIVDPPVDDDDDEPIDDDEEPVDDDDDTEIEGTPDIEFQVEPYVEGSDQKVQVPEDFLQENYDIDYEWYIEGYGIVGRGESVDLNLPAGKYNLTLIGRNSDDEEVFTVSREFLVQTAAVTEDDDLWDKVLDYKFAWIITIIALILIIIIFGYVLGRKRRSLKDQAPVEKIPTAVHQQRITRMPDRGSGSFVVTEDVISGKLEQDATMGADRELGDRQITPPATKNIDFHEIKVMNEAIDIVRDGKNEGTSLNKVKAKLERSYREGEIEKSDFGELSEVLDKYMK